MNREDAADSDKEVAGEAEKMEKEKKIEDIKEKN